MSAFFYLLFFISISLSIYLRILKFYYLIISYWCYQLTLPFYLKVYIKCQNETSATYSITVKWTWAKQFLNSQTKNARECLNGFLLPTVFHWQFLISDIFSTSLKFEACYISDSNKQTYFIKNATLWRLKNATVLMFHAFLTFFCLFVFLLFFIIKFVFLSF